METTQWVVVAWLALSALFVFVRGVAGVTRTYTVMDAIFGVIECAVIIWLVASL